MEENNKSLIPSNNNVLVKVGDTIAITDKILKSKDEKNNIEWWNNLDDRSKRILWNNLK